MRITPDTAVRLQAERAAHRSFGTILLNSDKKVKGRNRRSIVALKFGTKEKTQSFIKIEFLNNKMQWFCAMALPFRGVRWQVGDTSLSPPLIPASL
jgi:hypothetical protein